MDIRYAEQRITINLSVGEYILLMKQLNKTDVSEDEKFYKLYLKMENFMGGYSH